MKPYYQDDLLGDLIDSGRVVYDREGKVYRLG